MFRKKKLESVGSNDVSRPLDSVVSPCSDVGASLSSKGTSLSTELLSLAELAERHALNVPFRIRVINGFMAVDNMKDPTFLTDEIYSVHLVKETKVVKSHCGGSEYFIPLNSAATFGLIQDELNEGRIFANLQELVSCSPCPKLVAALNDCTDTDGCCVARQNDILAIKDVSLPRKRKSKVWLKAYNVSMQKEVTFHLDMDIKFTIKPSSIQLYLTELMEYTDLPSMCKIFSNNSSLSNSLTLSKVTLLEQETQRSVLVSLFRNNPTSKQKKATKFIEIPTRININVNIIDTNKEEQEYQQLIAESQELLHDYNPANIQPCMDSENDSAYMTQAQLLAEIRKEKERRTLTRLAPENYEEILIRQNKKPEQAQTQAQQSSREIENARLTKPTLQQYEEIADKERSLPKYSPKVPIPVQKQAHQIKKDKEKRRQVQSTPQNYEEILTGEEKELKHNSNSQFASSPLQMQAQQKQQKEEKKVLAQATLQTYEEILIGEEESLKQNGDFKASSTQTHLQINGTTNTTSVAKSPSVVKPPMPLPPRKPPAISRKPRLPPPRPVATQPIAGVYETLDTTSIHPPSTYEQTTFKTPDNDVSSHSSPVNTKKTVAATMSSTPIASPKIPDGTEGHQLNKQIQFMQERMLEMEKQIVNLTENQTHLEDEIRMLKMSRGQHVSQTLHVIHRGMSPQQILEVLEAIGLSQYKEAFAREVVDGEIFAVLDDDTLANELGVTSKIHRMRLQKLFQEN